MDIADAAANFPAGLADILERANTALADGATDPANPFRFLTLGTASSAGPALRTMVLRRFTRASSNQNPELDFHTDARSPKLLALAGTPRVGVLGWDQGARLQIRISGQTTCLEAAACDEIWRSLPASTRSTYAISAAPGTPIPSPEHAARTLGTSEAQAMFRVIRVRVDELEWLCLATNPHQRARFTFAEGAAHATWLVP